MGRPRVDRGELILSGISAEGTGTVTIDCRGSNGVFIRWYSGSAEGPAGASAGASAIYSLLHSHDQAHWVVLETLTASAGQNGATWFSAGAYAYLRAQVNECYSAAETGTGAIWVHIQPGVA